MLSSVQSKLGVLSSFQASSSTTSANAGKFSTLMAGAASVTALGTSSTGSGVSISDAARAAASSSNFEFDFSVTNVNHSQAEYAAHYAEGADRISAMQGLPSGQYDFTKLSPAEMHVVENHLLISGKVTPTDMVGFPSPNCTWDNNGTPVFGTDSQNWLTQAKDQLSYNTDGGYEKAAYFSARAIDIMTQLMTKGGKPDLTELPLWARPEQGSSQ